MEHAMGHIKREGGFSHFGVDTVCGSRMQPNQALAQNVTGPPELEK